MGSDYLTTLTYIRGVVCEDTHIFFFFFWCSVEHWLCRDFHPASFLLICEHLEEMRLRTSFAALVWDSLFYKAVPCPAGPVGPVSKIPTKTPIVLVHLVGSWSLFFRQLFHVFLTSLLSRAFSLNLVLFVSIRSVVSL